MDGDNRVAFNAVSLEFAVGNYANGADIGILARGGERLVSARVRCASRKPEACALPAAINTIRGVVCNKGLF